MNKLYKICAALLLTMTFGAEAMFAQATAQQVSVRDLHAYDVLPSSQADLPGHPLNGELVTFDAVVVSYPKNSGLASVTDEGVPGRIHVFVADVNAIEDGRNGMYIQIVVAGARRETLEGLFAGDVIRVVGNLTFFGNVSQFNTTDVTLLGSIADDPEYADLGPLLQPQVVSLSDLNIPSPDVAERFRWNVNSYSNLNHSYVKLEGLEVVGRLEAPTARPWLALSDGTSIIYTTDTSLRFRNDRTGGYAYNPETDQGLNYNWRRLSENFDGPYVPPAAGAVVDISGFIVVNTFNPAGFDESNAQSTLKIAPWDDGIVWLQDGTDTDFRFTEGVNNDLVVLGFPALVDNLVVTPGDEIDNATQATISVDVILPEDTYTLESVSVAYRAIGFDEDSSDLVTETMTGSGNTYTFTFAAFPDFTRIEYTINAVSTTPDNVETIGRLNGSIFVANEEFTVPPRFSPPAGTYANQVSVTLSTPTTGATIYYTTDGTDPDEASEIYGGSALTFDKTTTIRAYADISGKQASPLVTRLYVVEEAAVEVSTLADLRAGSQDGTVYLYTGEAVVTFTQNNRNQKFLMDETAGILIDDAGTAVITSTYAIGDIMTNLFVTVTNFNGLIQVNPIADPGASPGTKEIVPFETTLNDIDLSKHESALVYIRNVEFVEPSGDFATAQNYSITDPSIGDAGRTFRTNFFQANYIGEPVPSAAFNMLAVVGNFNGNAQYTARMLSDFDFNVSIDRGESPLEFALNQNYPNPFNPTTNINYTIAEVANVNLVVYDILGRTIATLVNEVQSPGFYNVNFDATRLASGTYIYRLEAAGQVSVKKMMLIK